MSKEKRKKRDIINSIYNKTGGVCEPDLIRNIVDELFEEIKDALKADKVVELRGFGTFEIRIRKKKEKARNPKTGDNVSVDSHGVVIFRSGYQLKEDVWKIGNNQGLSD